MGGSQKPECGLSCAIVASIEELRAALGHGVPGNKIVLSGSIKGREFLSLAILHGCTIAIDTLEEARFIARLRSGVGVHEPVNVICRASGFPVTTIDSEGEVQRRPEDSRFGFPLQQVDSVIDQLAHRELKDALRLIGFSFHIDNYAVWDRGFAAWKCIEFVLRARSAGHECDLIDIGGGIPNRYITRESWREFVNEYLELGEERSKMIFKNRDFGIRRFGDCVDSGYIYDHDAPAVKDSFLKSVLQWENPTGDTIEQLLKRNNIQLFIEPGRSLLDQAGITVCQIKGLKVSSQGTSLLVCSMNTSQMWDQMIGSEFLVDPILIRNPSNSHQRGPTECAIVGELCLESDVISWRKVKFPVTPCSGDLLIFVNTAGYQMDFAESNMHRIPLAKRLAIYTLGNEWELTLDEKFSGLNLLLD